MDPFYLFDLPLDATDEEVTARYHELITKYPPDRAPEQFATVRRAYEQLKSQSQRIKTRLFYLEPTGRSFGELVRFAPPTQRRRLPPGELATLLQRTREEKS